MCVGVAVVGIYVAFVNVGTFIAMFLVSEITVATEGTFEVDAVRVCRTDVGCCAFVRVKTFNDVIVVVVFGIVAFIAKTSEARFSVVAG